MLDSIVKNFQRIRGTEIGAVAPVLFALSVIWIYFGFAEPAFLSGRNFYYLFMQSAVVGTLAVGITVVLIIGDIDLSVAATSGVCAAILAVLSTNFGLPPTLACISAILAGIIM